MLESRVREEFDNESVSSTRARRVRQRECEFDKSAKSSIRECEFDKSAKSSTRVQQQQQPACVGSVKEFEKSV